MEFQSLLAYCLAAFAIIVVPGPTVTMIVANSLRYGSRAGMLNVAGTQAGLLIWLGIAVLGLTAAIKTMGVWFDVVRIAGALYLVWLGIGLWRSGGELHGGQPGPSQWQLLSSGPVGHPVEPQNAPGFRRPHPAVPFTRTRFARTAWYFLSPSSWFWRRFLMASTRCWPVPPAPGCRAPGSRLLSGSPALA